MFQLQMNSMDSNADQSEGSGWTALENDLNDRINFSSIFGMFFSSEKKRSFEPQVIYFEILTNRNRKSIYKLVKQKSLVSGSYRKNPKRRKIFQEPDLGNSIPYAQVSVSALPDEDNCERRVLRQSWLTSSLTK